MLRPRYALIALLLAAMALGAVYRAELQAAYYLARARWSPPDGAYLVNEVLAHQDGWRIGKDYFIELSDAPGTRYRIAGNVIHQNGHPVARVLHVDADTGEVRVASLDGRRHGRYAITSHE
ncbi:hypothetical protein [Lysobacter sp. CA199]|uniref:hypothetical protein n=1 Tax=Lysobacter sp. CA199 TaxID=3455608 RepID=UPI003F8D4FB1